MQQPYDFTMDIIFLRNYARTKDALDRASGDDDTPTGHMADLVWANYEAEQAARKQLDG